MAQINWQQVWRSFGTWKTAAKKKNGGTDPSWAATKKAVETFVNEQLPIATPAPELCTVGCSSDVPVREEE